MRTDSRPGEGRQAPTSVPPPAVPAPTEVPVAPSAPAAEPPAASHTVPEVPPAPVAEGRRYVVQQGDTLWSLARSLLGPAASTERVARLVDRLWDVNRDTIASGDPDVIRIGEILRLP
jgi:nucleoid-associated protein YgaU